VGTLVILAAFGLVNAAGQAVTHPGKGSAERTKLLETVRLPVEKELKQKVVFIVHFLNVQGNWAFLSGDLQTPSGGRPNFKITKYKRDEQYGIMDSNVQALLRKSGGRWKVVQTAIGCTDVCYVDWWKRFKAPKAIFPYTE
jgi:hypothetical protein